MRTFANLFLILFFVDGSLSLIDELVSLLAPVAPLSMLRASVASGVIYLAAALYLCLGLDRRLPKRLLLPLIVFLFLAPLSTWLFPSVAALKGFGLLIAALQLALGSPLVYRFHGNKVPATLALPPSQFEGRAFRWKNTLLFAAANVFILPAALVTLALYQGNSWAANASSGFMRVEPRGLYMMERVYRRDGRTIRLAGMIHVGEKEYYREVAQQAVSGRTLVLAEGVTDEKGLLRNKFDYGKVASFLGLTSQKEMLIPGRVIGPEALDAAQPPPGDAKAQSGSADILRADVDLSSFRPETMLLLDAIGRHLRENPSMLEAALALNDWAMEHITPQMNEIIMDDILHRRNRVLLSHLDKALQRYDTVVIPWGALHMKEIQAEVLKRGFVLQQERKMLSVDFKRLL